MHVLTGVVVVKVIPSVGRARMDALLTDVVSRQEVAVLVNLGRIGVARTTVHQMGACVVRASEGLRATVLQAQCARPMGAVCLMMAGMEVKAEAVNLGRISVARTTVHQMGACVVRASEGLRATVLQAQCARPMGAVCLMMAEMEEVVMAVARQVRTDVVRTIAPLMVGSVAPALDTQTAIVPQIQCARLMGAVEMPREV